MTTTTTQTTRVQQSEPFNYTAIDIHNLSNVILLFTTSYISTSSATHPHNVPSELGQHTTR